MVLKAGMGYKFELEGDNRGGGALQIPALTVYSAPYGIL